MCWESSQAVKQIAEEDIKVFKIGKRYEGMFYSMYKGFKYRLNQLYSINICIKAYYHYQSVFVGSRGFHSYDPSIVHLKISKNGIIRWAVYARQRRLDCDTVIAGYVIAECVIPKGTTYYENENGEIISEAIIVKQLKPIE